MEKEKEKEQNKVDSALLPRSKAALDNIRSSLNEPLPVKTDPASVEKLKDMVAYCEAQQYKLIAIMSYLNQVSASKTLQIVEETLTDKFSDKYGKVTESIRKAYIDGQLSEINSYKLEANELLKSVRSRVVLGQSLLKSYDNGYGM